MAIKPFKVRDKLLVGGSQVDGNVSAEFLANDAIQLPRGTTGERPSTGVNGLLRYNTTLAEIEGYISGAWGSVGGGANVQALGTAPGSPNLVIFGSILQKKFFTFVSITVQKIHGLT